LKQIFYEYHPLTLLQRLPPDGEDFNLTMRTPEIKHPQKPGGPEVGWICLSVKWGYGGRIEVRNLIFGPKEFRIHILLVAIFCRPKYQITC